MNVSKELGYNLGAADALGDIWGGHAHILNLAMPEARETPLGELPALAYEGSRSFSERFMEFAGVTEHFLQGSQRILELGPGRGPLVEEMILRNSAAAWLGVEYSQSNADRLIHNARRLGQDVSQFTLEAYADAVRQEKILPQYVVIVDDAHDALPGLIALEEKFDRVLAMESIMHMRRLTIMIYAAELLVPGGVIGWSDVNLRVRDVVREAVNPFFEMGFKTTFKGSVETYESMLADWPMPLEHEDVQEAFDASNTLATRLLSHEDFVQRSLSHYSKIVLMQLRTALRVIAPAQEYRLFRVSAN